MIRGLQVVLIVYGVIGILDGLALIVAPQLFARIWGFGEIVEISDFGIYIAAICGAAFVAACVWIVVAGRDPLRHIMWVKFAILWNILAVVVMLYLVVQGTIDFSQAAMGIIGGAVLAAALLALYPYRAARGG
jgi:hypothetical protein